MDPRLNDVETALQDRVRSAAAAVVAAADDIDRGAATAADAIGSLAAEGVLSICSPEAHGGGGGGAVELALACEEIGAASASVGVVVVGHWVAGSLIDVLGDDAQKQEWLPVLATGAMLAALAVDGGGSLLETPGAGVSTTPEAGGLRLDGTARAVAGATLADLLVVPVQVGDSVMVAVVEAESDGITIGPEGAKLGLNGAGLAAIEFSGLCVPTTSTLRAGDVALALAAAADGARIGHAAVSVGIGRAALDASSAYVVASGDGLDREQSVQWMLADMATETEAARLLTWYAASRTTAGELREAAAMARLLATDAAVGASRSAVQIFGTAGNERGAGVERLYRDAKAMEVHHGAAESQRLAVARELLPDLFEGVGPGAVTNR